VIHYLPHGGANPEWIRESVAMETEPMEITKTDIREIPWEWAQDFAEECDPDWALHYADPYDAIRAAWPENKPQIEELLYSLTTLENT
jgi:hypothetical protein